MLAPKLSYPLKRQTVLELIDSIRAKKTEQAYLLDCLALWHVAKEAGYDAHEVKAFSFRPEFLTLKQKRQHRRAKRLRASDRLIEQDKYHNCVRFHTGELNPIPLTERPYDDRNK